ncbi:uncharacterized protein LOC112196572 isoform X4 [Rosa chinensis]|uniref:uncharacterized protein LOC112196572 isoform X4 n=1 Tax=Rosa chinensis TaxID=74649 RepID=UPI001AD8E506|nr:uncharacterized protein LOC112196572 isoform X4 [Rosa chinensis]
MSSRARGRRNRGIKVLQAEKPLLVQKKNKSGGTKPNQPKIIPSPLKKGTKSEESKLSAAPSPSGDNICHVYKYWPRIRDGKPVEPEIYTVPRVMRPDSDFGYDGSDVEPLLSLPGVGDFGPPSPDIIYDPW